MPRSRRPRNALRLKWDRSLGLALFSAVALLAILGVVFAVALGTKEITKNASALHDADETLRASTVVRAQLALAAHTMAVDLEFGTNSSQPRAISLSEARQALADMEAGLRQLRESGHLSEQLASSADHFVTHSQTIIDGLGESNLAPDALLALDQSFQDVSGALVDVRQEIALEVEQSDAWLGRIGDFSRFLVAFLIPLAVILVYRELLKRQQRQADLETRLDAARQLNQAREEFVANASHELRTPLTSIIGLSTLLSENPVIAENESANDLLSIIIGQSDDLARMVEDLLTTARLDSGALHFAFEDIDIQQAVTETIEPHLLSGEVFSADCEPGVVRADRLRLRQLIRNLLSNARKYGGSTIRIEGRTEGRTYVCSVIDDGPGVPQELEDRLFERFIHQGHQTATKESVGLGLSIVHALTEGMGGSISYRRVDGETHFEIRVPLSSEPEDGRIGHSAQRAA
ncbi:MAG: hypothetical protein HKO03_12275 [Acidimicrobiia bacterium]|nr:hypothetical protein [Acidimicrobiia bacterium]